MVKQICLSDTTTAYLNRAEAGTGQWLRLLERPGGANLMLVPVHLSILTTSPIQVIYSNADVGRGVLQLCPTSLGATASLVSGWKGGHLGTTNILHWVP